MSLVLDFGSLPANPTREERLRELGFEEVSDDHRSAVWIYFDHHQRNMGMLLPAQTPLESRFKLAGLRLFLEGRYPSGRAIKRELGYDVSGQVRLNGRECKWKAELFHTLHIEPFWWRKLYREEFVHLSADWLPYWRRCPRGSLTWIAYRKVPV